MLTPLERSVVWDRKKKVAVTGRYLYCCLGILAIYVAAGALSPRLLAWFDVIVVPMTHALDYFGLGIHKPFLQWTNADVPSQFCTNVIGVVLWIIIITNLKSFLFYCKYRWSVPLTEGAVQLAKQFKPYQGGSWRKWIIAILLWIFLAGIGILSVLNATHGWLTFYFKDFYAFYFWAAGYLMFFGMNIVQFIYGLKVYVSYLPKEE